MAMPLTLSKCVFQNNQRILYVILLSPSIVLRECVAAVVTQTMHVVM
jgi:hypothetical protein